MQLRFFFKVKTLLNNAFKQHIPCIASNSARLEILLAYLDMYHSLFHILDFHKILLNTKLTERMKQRLCIPNHVLQLALNSLEAMLSAY